MKSPPAGFIFPSQALPCGKTEMASLFRQDPNRLILASFSLGIMPTPSLPSVLRHGSHRKGPWIKRLPVGSCAEDPTIQLVPWSGALVGRLENFSRSAGWRSTVDYCEQIIPAHGKQLWRTCASHAARSQIARYGHRARTWIKHEIDDLPLVFRSA